MYRSGQEHKEPHLLIPPYPLSSPEAAVLREKLLQMKKKVSQSLEPELSRRVKQVIRQKYNRLLEKVEKARRDLERKGFPLKNTDSQEFLRDKQQLTRFYTCLADHLDGMIPEILNQLAEKLSKSLEPASKDNLIAKAIALYPSLIGSYMYKPTLKQILTPTVRTLHHLEQQMLENYSETRGSEGSLWVFMYLISAIFVHLFGKYITPFEKLIVAELIREAFILSIIYMITSLELPSLDVDKLQQTIDKWLSQIRRLMGSRLPAL